MGPWDDSCFPLAAAGTEELDEAQQAWAAREAEYEGRLAERSSRADPLGTDRFHRRYWWLACMTWGREGGPGVLDA